MYLHTTFYIRPSFIRCLTACPAFTYNGGITSPIHAQEEPNMSENEIFENNLEDDPDDYRVTLDLDDGTSVECAILTILEVDGQDYIVLVPVDENDEPMEEGEVYIYRYYEDEDGTPSLENIDTEEEFEKVSDRFDEYLDEQEFNDLP